MPRALQSVTICLALASRVLATGQAPTSDPSKAEQLFAFANQARLSAGVGPPTWDSNLAGAAFEHCLRMTAEGPIAHQYAGEPDLTSRAGAAGAHFSIIEENIAVGSRLETLHQGWLNSAEHRANLLNPSVDRVGIAVVVSGGMIFAVADYSRSVVDLTQTQVEAAFAELLRAKHLTILSDTTEARAYCASSGKYAGNEPPKFLIRWQNPDVVHLPGPLLEQIANKEYHKAAVGNCPAQDVNGAFTVYRVAVLLY
jgi:hypothetical protein